MGESRPKQRWTESKYFGGTYDHALIQTQYTLFTYVGYVIINYSMSKHHYLSGRVPACNYTEKEGNVSTLCYGTSEISEHVLVFA